MKDTISNRSRLNFITLMIIFCLGMLSAVSSFASDKTSNFEKLNIFSDQTESNAKLDANINLLAMSDTSNSTSIDVPLSEPTDDAQQTEADDNQTDEPDEKPGLWQRFKKNVALTWDSPTRDFYLPVNTWHNRLVYDDEDIDRYNEFPVGAGYGVSRFDEDGDWHALYALGFSDSNYEFEPFVGYAYEKQWGNRNGWHYGLGFTAAITAREELGYIPIPAILPLASFGYKRVTVQSSYVPGSSSNGNVLFTWIRFQINDPK